MPQRLTHLIERAASTRPAALPKKQSYWQHAWRAWW
jgi:hypothetical protein